MRRRIAPAALTGLICGVTLLMAGCQSPAKPAGGLLMFPAPPEKPRMQFLTWASGAKEVEKSRGSFADFVLGEQAQTPRRMDKPYGVAARDGVAYVCDTKSPSLCRLDFKKRQYSLLGTDGPGKLRKPINVVIDELGYKFVVDTERKQVVVFGPDDRYVTAHGLPEPARPVDVAAYGNELFVLDNDATCEIVVLDRRSGEVLRKFGAPGAAPGQFKIPNSIAVSPDGYLYVSDTHNFRIQKLTRDGQSVWVAGVPGYRLGQFGRPRGIRVGPDGIVYVVDGATELVQMFDPDGNILMRFGGPGEKPGAMVLPSTVAVDQSSLDLFRSFLHKDFKADYLVFVANQYGEHLIGVYAFGAFPEGYELSESDFATLPAIPPATTTAPGEAERANETPP